MASKKVAKRTTVKEPIEALDPVDVKSFIKQGIPIAFEEIQYLQIRFRTKTGYIRLYESSPGSYFVACNGLETDISIPEIIKCLRLMKKREFS